MKYLISLSLIALLLTTTVVYAGTDCEEKLYLADTTGYGDGTTTLFEVELDLKGNKANLFPLPDVGFGVGKIPLDVVLAIAVTPDGSRLYAVDNKNGKRGTGMLGYYDLNTPNWTSVGPVLDGTAPLTGIVQLVFVPDGSLLLVSATTDSLYTVDPNTGAATLVGPVVHRRTGATVDIHGGDIAFAHPNTLYLWANHSREGAPRGVYQVVGVKEDEVLVRWKGLAKLDQFITGMAVRFNGAGKLVASTHEDNILIMARGRRARVRKVLPMTLNGEPYNVYEFGDMSIGALK